MRSACPHCGSTEEENLGGIELGPDGSSDERWLGLLRCRGCRAAFVYFYEESRRGRLDDERSHESMSPLEETLAVRFAALIAACPAPRSAGCECESHRLLRQDLDLREVLAAQPLPPPPPLTSLARPSLARPSLARPSLAQPSLVRPSLYLVVLLACTVWSVHIEARQRWALLLILPPTVLVFVWAVLARHAPLQKSATVAARLLLALGLALGLAAVWRWGG